MGADGDTTLFQILVPSPMFLPQVGTAIETVKNYFRANFTLSPVRRASAFFALLIAVFSVLFTSCSDEEALTHQLLVKEQAEVFEQIEALVVKAVDDPDSMDQAVEEATKLFTKLRDLKRQTGELAPPSEEELAEIANSSQLVDAQLSLQKTLTDLQRKHGEQIDLSAFQQLFLLLHDPAPLVNEGRSD